MPSFLSFLSGGLSPGPGGGLPPTLDAAIAARYAGDVDLTTLSTEIRNGQASDGGTVPYLVFKVTGGSPNFSSADSHWIDQKVRFECVARTAEAANTLARAVVAAFGGPGVAAGVSLSYQAGVTTPLVLTGNAEAAERNRGKDNARVYRSTVEYSARARLGRPS